MKEIKQEWFNTTEDRMEDFREDGYNAGRGQAWRNDYHEPPQTDGDRYSYRVGFEEGQQRQRVAQEIDGELYGDGRW